jgi:hypothetical protein
VIPVQRNDCAGCREAETYARHTGVWVHCDECGAAVSVDKRAAARAERSQRRDGHRTAEQAKAGLVRDLENLARWPDLCGRSAFAPSPVVGDGNRGGGAKRSAAELPDRLLDERASRERARATLARLEAIERAAATLPGYYSHAARTLRCILERCGDAQVCGVIVGGRQVGTTFLEVLGRHLASVEQLAEWHRAVGRGDSGAARAGLAKLGDDSLCLATAIWLGLL